LTGYSQLWEHEAVKVYGEAAIAAADYAPSTGTPIFDIGGNQYRLVARVDFEEEVLYIESVMTHEEYDREDL
jgi:mRNA-degrading endonuclease HigB of HigAB toxin-antitoxin module